MLKKRILTIGVLAVLLLPAVPVLAEGSGSSSGDSQTTTSETETHNSTKLEQAETKLEANRLKACQNRQNSINKRLTNIVNRGNHQLKVFDGIATKVEQFATDKNAKPANYDALVQAIADQKAAAQAALTKIESDKVSFKCDGSGGAKAALETFRTDLKTEISALKNYRTAVKNLIVGVKTTLNASQTETNNEAQ